MRSASRRLAASALPAGDIEGRPVIAAGADDGPADRDLQPQPPRYGTGIEPLVVIHRDNPVELAAPGPDEERIGGHGP